VECQWNDLKHVFVEQFVIFLKIVEQCLFVAYEMVELQVIVNLLIAF